jgi:hypothetical protein
MVVYKGLGEGGCLACWFIRGDVVSLGALRGKGVLGIQGLRGLSQGFLNTTRITPFLCFQ